MSGISRFLSFYFIFGVKKPRVLTSKKPNEQINMNKLTKKKRKCTNAVLPIYFLE